MAMEPEKERYLKLQLEQITQRWTGISTSCGAVFFILLSTMDYFATPVNFQKFLVYRFSIASLLFVLFLLNRVKRNVYYQNTLIVIGVALSAVTIELMILSFGGHKSPYYAGMNLLILAVLGLIPLNLFVATLATCIIYSTYLFPILLFDRIDDPTSFIISNAFMVSILSMAFLWRILSHRSIVTELNLQYDLEQQKEQLRRYSTQLEQLVEERTRELNKSELMLRSLFDNANDGIMIMNSDGVILDANQKACDMHGFNRDTLLGTNIKLLETQENQQLYKDRMARILKGESLLFETQHYRRDGTKISLDISSKAIEVEGATYVQSFHRDITEKKRLQEQLFQSQKMESIGVLAGGIAHDFNNILSAILGHAELLHEFSNLDAAGKERVRIIENSARKAGQMISKLLSFARKGNFESVPISLNDIVKDTVDLLERMITKRNIAIKMDIDRALPPVEGDANQLEQVVMNIIVNAGDVMPSGGVITVATSSVDLQKDAASVHPLLVPGRYVVLKISDTGPGIPEEIRDKIFDPFFTTKGPGKGTGLGLAMVYGIVKEHQGVIDVRTKLGSGTTFAIYLPASGKLVPRLERPSVSSIVGREKILVVDDEEDVVSFIKDVLEAQGYKVLATTNPVYALDLFKEIHDTIDLVISDIIMPLVNGRELIRHFKLIKPAVSILAISGYEAGTIDKNDRDINGFIRKPFEGIYLLTVVRRVLNATGAPSSSRRMPLSP
jgi:two-component system cell cycle sensor histidine kinase/response regulator CckA